MTRSSSKSRGFVLVATLWVLIAMTIFVSYFSVVVSDSQNQAIEMKSHLQEKLDRQATLTTLVYLMSTRPMSYGGIRMERIKREGKYNPMDAPNPYLPSGQEIRLDGRLYKGIGKAVFSIQDAGSLISLRGDDFSRLEELLEVSGVSRRGRVKMIATLLDYFDKDAQRSLDGAEYSEYKNKNRLGPTNRHLTSPRQLFNILNWDENLSDEQLEGLLNEVSIYVGNNKNYNTMTRRGMETIGVSEVDINEIMDHRIKNSFVSVSEINLLTGSLIRSDPFSQPFYPTKNLRISIGHMGKERVEWVGVSLTPSSKLAPWQIDYKLYKNDTRFDLSNSNAANVIENTATTLLN